MEHPQGIRRHILDLETVAAGQRRAALLFIDPSEAPHLLGVCRTRGLVASMEPAAGPASYLQAGITERARLKDSRRIVAAVGPDATFVRDLLAGWTSDYWGTGERLGYPICCVRWAAKADRRTFDPLWRVERQTNLVDLAVAASHHLAPICNTFFRESVFSSYGPTALISHYPCTLDCSPSQRVGAEAGALLARLAPTWALLLSELLRSPVIQWSDRYWPAHFWDEYAALAVIGGRAVPVGRTFEIEGGDCVPSGLGVSPAGLIPHGPAKITLSSEEVRVRPGSGEPDSVLCHAANGIPKLLEWSAGTIHCFAT